MMLSRSIILISRKVREMEADPTKPEDYKGARGKVVHIP